MSKPNLLTLNLQFFADGEEFGAYDPQSAYEGIQAGEPTNPEPIEQGQPDVNPEQPPAQPDFLDFGGRKIQANEELSGLHKDFTEQQRYITSLQEQVNAYKQLAQMQQAQPQQQQQEQPVSADTTTWDEDTWNKFYENPNEVLAPVLQKMIQEQVGPIVQEREWNQEITRMYESYPDFEQFAGEVQQLVQQYPDKYANQQGGLEDAYFRAKALKGFSQPSPEALAQDPQFIQQYVLQNQDVQNQILNNYFQQKQQTNQQIPNVMGRGGGFTPQTPESSPTNLREASRQFMKNMGYR